MIQENLLTLPHLSKAPTTLLHLSKDMYHPEEAPYKDYEAAITGANLILWRY